MRTTEDGSGRERGRAKGHGGSACGHAEQTKKINDCGEPSGRANVRQRCRVFSSARSKSSATRPSTTDPPVRPAPALPSIVDPWRQTRPLGPSLTDHVTASPPASPPVAHRLTDRLAPLAHHRPAEKDPHFRPPARSLVTVPPADLPASPSASPSGQRQQSVMSEDKKESRSARRP